MYGAPEQDAWADGGESSGRRDCRCGVPETAPAPESGEAPGDKAREGGIPSAFRPKRNDEGRAAARFSRDALPFECRVGSTTGC